MYELLLLCVAVVIMSVSIYMLGTKKWTKKQFRLYADIVLGVPIVAMSFVIVGLLFYMSTINELATLETYQELFVSLGLSIGIIVVAGSIRYWYVIKDEYKNQKKVSE